MLVYHKSSVFMGYDVGLGPTEVITKRKLLFGALSAPYVQTPQDSIDWTGLVWQGIFFFSFFPINVEICLNSEICSKPKTFKFENY
jgi:hypothetical protein